MGDVMINTRAVIIMGVSGSGKSTVGSALAAHLDWTFADADDFHPPHNLNKMARGEPLTDADREPWLGQLHQLLQDHQTNQKNIVLACSALKSHYRDILVGSLEGIQVVFLQGSPELIAQRIAQRQHFMPLSLLESQLATLEPPQNALVVDIALPLERMVLEIVAWLE
jgi:gluconokinase